MRTHRLGVASVFLLVTVFVALPLVVGPIPGASLSGPPPAQALPAWEYLTIERETELSEIIVTGKVVRVDPAKWNGPHGKKAGMFSCASWDPMVYATFYVQPEHVLKGTPKWGTPIAFRLSGAITESGTTDAFIATMTTTEDDSGPATRLAVGDTVVVFGEVGAQRYGGGVYEPEGAYWLTMDDSSLWSGSEAADGGKVRNRGLMRYQDEREMSVDSLTAKIQAYVKNRTGTQPGVWSELKPSGPVPSARFGETLVSLSASGKVFMFGGAKDEKSPLGDAWTYDPLANTWARLKPTGEAPPARWGAAAAYLPRSNRVVVFGGMGEDGIVLRDTWIYGVADNHWSRLVTAAAPSPRYRAAIAYDPVTRTVILFGGRTSTSTDRSYSAQDFLDTWELDVNEPAWAVVSTPGGPSEVAAGSAALVPERLSSNLLLLVGLPPLPFSAPAISDDALPAAWSIWEFDSEAHAWRDLGKTGSPCPVSENYALAYDPDLERAVLFGGTTMQHETLGDTWLFEGDAWRIAGSGESGGPSPRVDTAMVYDRATHRIILFGGRSAEGAGADLPNQTWGYAPGG